jgi:hypothetical protein|tara:strand:+ start:10656 stop:10997 length:342 start_codon:yes stop_codon:yes gene_type:complete
MPYTRITFNNPINSSLQLGDTIHYSSAQAGPTLVEPQTFGPVVEIVKDFNYIIVEQDVTSFDFTNQDYVFFSKNISVNESSIKGYHANVTMENNSNTKSELFAVSSEVTISSK